MTNGKLTRVIFLVHDPSSLNLFVITTSDALIRTMPSMVLNRAVIFQLQALSMP